MSFPDSFLDEIRQRVPLHEVIGRSVSWDKKSQPAKGDHWACCPFHAEKSPSFHCDDRKGMYHCFGCKASGDHFKFLTEKQGLTFPEAVEVLAREAGLPMPTFSPQEAEREKLRVSLLECCEEACRIFSENLRDEAGVAARAYLEARGVPEGQVMRFRLGYAKNPRSSLFGALRAKKFSEDCIIAAGLAKEPVGSNLPADRFFNRLMFPIADARGRIVGFGGRALTEGQEPKYLNSPEGPLFDKSKLLYNRHLAKEAAEEAGALVLVEGYMDALAFDRAGVAHVAAPMGTAITAEQLTAAWGISDEPMLCLDGDAAGQKAAARTMDLALAQLKPGKSLTFVTLPADKDPDDILREQGADALKAMLEVRQSLVDRLWASLTDKADVATPERRAKFQQDVVEAVARISDTTARKHYETELISRLKAFWKDKGLKAVAPAFEKKTKGKERAGEEGGSSDVDLENIIATMNESYAAVVIGARPAILMDGVGDAGAAFERFRIINVDAHKFWFANQKVRCNGRLCSKADIWLEHPQRRQYRGLEFMPAPPGVSDGREGYFNLWRGYDVEPKRDQDLAALWLNHVHEVLACKDDAYYDWIVSWFAFMVQHPRERLGKALVLRGGQGVGKTITGKIVGSLFPANYYLIDDSRYLTGQFNHHQGSALMLQADEGFWAGDKQAEGRLKGLITSEFQMIEYKGVDPIRLPNYVWLMISSNEEWVVPTGPRERRFAVFDVGATKMQDQKYFAALDACYREPAARAALLFELANWKIDEKALRKVPSTEALWHQKLRSFDSYQGWLAGLLIEGGPGHGADWPEYMECADLHANYLRRCERLGLRHPLSSDSFGIRLRKTMPDVKRAQRNGRKWCYLLPTLEAAREKFAQDVDYEVPWTDEGSFVVSNEQEAEPM